ncbi:hypothetical protein M885DRAFT_566291 [Pelagophyceae sp. CCMP2097]|nr:hypothetical protein M885DRAFT_566291 [Pelagophyceae sp. CCMP2097]
MLRCPFDRCFYEQQHAVDDRIDAFCAWANCNFGHQDSRNMLRQFDTEYSLAQHLLESGFKYDLVVAISEDIAPLLSIPAADVANALQPNVFVGSNSYDYAGFTNGLYVATPKAMHALSGGLERRVFQNQSKAFFVKMRHNGNITSDAAPNNPAS